MEANEQIRGIQVWDVMEGKGKVNYIIAGYLYSTLKLLDFNELTLNAYKQSVWIDSMENKALFDYFFNLRPKASNVEIETSMLDEQTSEQIELFDHSDILLQTGINSNTTCTANLLAFLSPKLYDLLNSSKFKVLADRQN